tara:strand:+ start:1021 stop:1212 length:192 start_codon:yes stop_codon:yes gene_type:complete
MTVGETLKMLENSENYTEDRLTVSDEFIEMAKVMLPYDFERIQTKEKDYEDLLDLIRCVNANV